MMMCVIQIAAVMKLMVNAADVRIIKGRVQPLPVHLGMLGNNLGQVLLLPPMKEETLQENQEISQV